MQDKPSISVILPTHNRSDSLLKAVRSIFGQTLLPKELVVIDDGSNPSASEEILKSPPKGLIVKLLRNDLPKGAPTARNQGTTEASGDWIAFLDDDDLFMPDKIEQLSQAIQNNPNADVFYHPAQIKMVKENVSYISGATAVGKGNKALKKLLVKNIVGGTSMVTVSKQTLLMAGGFDPSSFLEDWDLWIRLAKQNKQFVFIDKPLTVYHHHFNMKSITKNKEQIEHSFVLLEQKFANEYAALSKKETRTYQINKLKTSVFHALLHNQRSRAFNLQLRVFYTSLSVNDLAVLASVPFGIKTVFKLRSLVP